MTKRLQVLLNDEWQYVFCRNELFQDPITTKNKSKAVDRHGLNYFISKYANHNFQVV